MDNVLRCRQCGLLPGDADNAVCPSCGNTDWQMVVIDPANPPAPDDPVVPA